MNVSNLARERISVSRATVSLITSHNDFPSVVQRLVVVLVVVVSSLVHLELMRVWVAGRGRGRKQCEYFPLGGACKPLERVLAASFTFRFDLIRARQQAASIILSLNVSESSHVVN